MSKLVEIRMSTKILKTEYNKYSKARSDDESLTKNHDRHDIRYDII